ncbi:choloylglycine hydrolase family protein [Kaistia dalseonensis]|uniref:Choloylglycine hydrolase n=1 Tax=Kaistia dalseonensis TaxID=410840 RepID=A0ABU0HF11_9HYPH|nr:choloylglycine hydrolase family protein [Kaistia dalseonensis]MCX5497430.1 choloylglycine hydrolase family protein [Kaistia dalseonensis]MDQ0440069.1 choloylglycine hydrolase [Kaistia dalseonensis]
MLRALLATVSIIATVNASYACTAVDIVAADKTVIAGRTMEWAFDMQWTLVSQPKGTEIALSAPAELKLPTITVPTKYAVVGVSAAIIPGGALLEGQNAAGLGMSGNFLPGFTQYQAVSKTDKSYVSILDFGSWALGNHASVADLRAALPTIKVWSDDSLPSGPTPPTIHFVFTDRSGDGMVVEYVGGELQIHDNVAHVLTNAPTYDWHLLNTRNYLNLTTIGVSSREISTANVTALGQGGGLMGLPGDFTPPSRFIRAAFMRHNITPPANADEAVQAIGHILNTVDIPLGIAQSTDGKEIVSDYTQWVAIKDLTHNTLKIADYAHRTTFVTLDLNTIFAQEKPSAVLVEKLPYPAAVDGTSALKN